MGIEMPNFGAPKNEQNNSEQYQKEALVIAQRISQPWQKLKEALQSDPQFLIENPQLSEIYGMTRPPKSGIQAWFEDQVKFIETSSGGDESAKSHMTYRLKEDLERIEKAVNDLIVEKPKTLTKADLDRELAIYDGKKYSEWDLLNNRVPEKDNPYEQVILGSGLRDGDEVLFFVERERSGVLEKNKNGFAIRDANGNPWGIGAILNMGYIKKG